MEVDSLSTARPVNPETSWKKKKKKNSRHPVLKPSLIRQGKEVETGVVDVFPWKGQNLGQENILN